jgi:hypothetical protein
MNRPQNKGEQLIRNLGLTVDVLYVVSIDKDRDRCPV